MKDTRTNNSIKNSISSIILYIINIAFGFITQAIFICALGAEYNGIQGLYSNILSMLTIAELRFWFCYYL